MEVTNYYYIFANIVLLLTSTQMFSLAKTTTNLATDQSALLALKANIALDPRHILARNWTNSSSVCSWIRVTCNLRHHRVSALNISNMGLSGTIPPFLANLSFLVSLDLSFNPFSGSVPNELSLLHRLKFISPRNNSLSSVFPISLSNLSNLQVLGLSNNDLQVLASSLSSLFAVLHKICVHNWLPSSITNLGKFAEKFSSSSTYLIYPSLILSVLRFQGLTLSASESLVPPQPPLTIAKALLQGNRMCDLPLTPGVAPAVGNTNRNTGPTLLAQLLMQRQSLTDHIEGLIQVRDNLDALISAQKGGDGGGVAEGGDDEDVGGAASV